MVGMLQWFRAVIWLQMGLKGYAAIHIDPEFPVLWPAWDWAEDNAYGSHFRSAWMLRRSYEHAKRIAGIVPSYAEFYGLRTA